MPDTLRQQQFQFAAHLRDPAHCEAPPGLEDRRLAVYRELFFNNIEGLLAGNFPVIRKTFGDARWHALVRAFYSEHRSHTPLFAEIGQEFIGFLRDRATQGMDDPAWLAEMAHYEWIELALQIADDAIPAHDADGDLLTGIPVLSPFAWALAYRWPVPHIGPDYQPDVAPEAPTLLLVRRDAKYDIRFAEISPLVFRLIEILRNGESTGRQTLQLLASEAGITDVTSFVDQGVAMLQRMLEEDTILGSRPL